jgi:hypothetical protein
VPLGHPCESCGRRAGPPGSIDGHALGVLSQTLCPPCAEFGGPPRITVGTAVRLVAHHTGHLGIDVDEMAQAMRKDR